jgi:hypothetical protein
MMHERKLSTFVAMQMLGSKQALGALTAAWGRCDAAYTTLSTNSHQIVRNICSC